MPDDRCCLDCEQARVRLIRELCSACYQRRRKAGLELPPRRNKTHPPKPLDLVDFEKHLKDVVPDAHGCWPWPGTVNKRHGYGVMKDHARAHVVSFVFHKGPVPDKRDVGHLCHDRDPSCSGGPTCKHRACINPDHLGAQTRQENLLAKHAKRKCKNGHKYTPETTAVNEATGGRYCIPCTYLTLIGKRDEALARRRAERRALAEAEGRTYHPRPGRRRPDVPTHWIEKQSVPTE